jgi:hypothetical protein
LSYDVNDDDLDLESIGLEAAFIPELWDDDSVCLPVEETEPAELAALPEPAAMDAGQEDDEYPPDFSLQIETD